MNELTVGHLRDILHMSDTENYNKGGICTVKTMQNTYSKNLCRSILCTFGFKLITCTFRDGLRRSLAAETANLHTKSATVAQRQQHR